jgi:hypothetical protein
MLVVPSTSPGPFPLPRRLIRTDENMQSIGRESRSREPSLLIPAPVYPTGRIDDVQGDDQLRE